MNIKTSDLTGLALNFAVAQALGLKPQAQRDCRGNPMVETHSGVLKDYSHSMADGAELLERYSVDLSHRVIDGKREVMACIRTGGDMMGPVLVKHWAPTILIAGMRCIVELKLGRFVDVPDMLAAREDEQVQLEGIEHESPAPKGMTP